MSFRTLTWTVVVLAAVVLVGCDDKGSSADTTEGTASTTVAVTDPARSSDATSTTAPADFDTAVAELDAALDAAEGDLCALVSVTQPLTVVPQTAEQARQMVDLIVKMVRSMGEVAEPADAKVYAAAAERLEDEAADNDYSPEWLTGREAFVALDDPDFFEASRRLQQRYQAKCGPTATTAAPG